MDVQQRRTLQHGLSSIVNIAYLLIRTPTQSHYISLSILALSTQHIVLIGRRSVRDLTCLTKAFGRWRAVAVN